MPADALTSTTPSSIVNSARRVRTASADVQREDLGCMSGLDHVRPIGDGGTAGFADEAEDAKACGSRCSLDGLPLSEAEVHGDGDGGKGDGAAEVGLGSFPQVGEEHR